MQCLVICCLKLARYVTHFMCVPNDVCVSCHAGIYCTGCADCTGNLFTIQHLASTQSCLCLLKAVTTFEEVASSGRSSCSHGMLPQIRLPPCSHAGYYTLYGRCLAAALLYTCVYIYIYIYIYIYSSRPPDSRHLVMALICCFICLYLMKQLLHSPSCS